MDVSGPLIHKSLADRSYYICFKDEETGFRKVTLIKTKDESLNAFKSVVNEIKSETGNDVRRIRSDRGTEF